MAVLSLRFRSLIEERLGLNLDRRDDTWVSEHLQQLKDAAGYSCPVAFLEALEQASLEAHLWAHPLEVLTIPETYFFRDLGQMELLREEIFPQLSFRVKDRAVRVWSAGCSTGEELYSLAILADSLGLAAEFVGTDINPSALEVARRGLYRERSLRGFSGELRERYLLSVPDGFEVLPRLRERARFALHNLCNPARELGSFDLILCRNVVIYFSREKVPAILDTFYRALRPGGILMTGHGELMGVDSPLELVSYPQSAVYRRPEMAKPKEKEPARVGARPLRIPELTGQQGEDLRAPEVASLCRLGRQARLAGETERARELFRQALYLDPESVPVFLEKSLLLLEEDPERARKDFATAMDLLAGMPLERRLADDVALPLAELENFKF